MENKKLIKQAIDEFIRFAVCLDKDHEYYVEQLDHLALHVAANYANFPIHTLKHLILSEFRKIGRAS